MNNRNTPISNDDCMLTGMSWRLGLFSDVTGATNAIMSQVVAHKQSVVTSDRTSKGNAHQYVLQIQTNGEALNIIPINRNSRKI